MLCDHHRPPGPLTGFLRRGSGSIAMSELRLLGLQVKNELLQQKPDLSARQYTFSAPQSAGF